MTNLQDISEITGFNNLSEPEERGNWLVWEQRGSRGVMADKVKLLKEAGIPAFFSASDRVWGIKSDNFNG